VGLKGAARSRVAGPWSAQRPLSDATTSVGDVAERPRPGGGFLDLLHDIRISSRGVPKRPGGDFLYVPYRNSCIDYILANQTTEVGISAEARF
jgi:hypothetical protein